MTEKVTDGDEVQHDKYGRGWVAADYGDRLAVEFEHPVCGQMVDRDAVTPID